MKDVKSMMVREDWLNAAVESFRPMFEMTGHPLPPVVHISTGFALARSMGENKNIRAQTFSSHANDDSNLSVFISPFEKDTAHVLQVLVHELIHVTLDNEDGHTGRFRAIAKMVGLESPLLEVHADLALTEQCEWLTKELGEYPHAGMDKLAEILTGAPVGPGGVPISGSPMRRWTSGPKTQTARMIKCMCPVDSCGYSLRTTRRWIDVATPICPVHLSAMTVGA